MNRGHWLRWLSLLTVAVVAVALVFALVLSPPERIMGQRIRILYVHVGAAWTAYLSYAITALAATMFLWRGRSPRWDRLALGSAELGVVLTTVTLATGSIWGKSTQGWWWLWEPRLTITLFMWFLYAGYLILRQYTAGERQAVLSAALALVGVPTMVLNHFAVLLWRTYHPDPVIVRPEGPALEGTMFLWGLALSLVAYTLVYVTLLAARIQLETRRAELAALRTSTSGH